MASNYDYFFFNDILFILKKKLKEKLNLFYDWFASEGFKYLD